MGVRFQCPGGHKLHVKAELAGKRGICPECGAKFVVPSFSGGRVAVDTSTPPVNPPAAAGAAAASSSGPLSPSAASANDGPSESVIIPTQSPPLAQPIAANSPAQALASPSPTAANHEPVAWYVRPAGGGQFGPATSEVFRQWIEDGRVAVDSWVWRTGWADWKAGSEALALTADRPPLEPVAAMAAVLEAPASTLAFGASSAHVEPGSAEARRTEIKRRKQRVRAISSVLALVALAMLMALVFVLAR